MLDSTVAMLQILLAIMLAFFQETPISITSPQTGETLRGQISIAGNMNIPNFTSAELAFSYASDSTSTWFTIQSFSQPVQDTALATWDTTKLTDGDYTLRLRVSLQDGSFQDVLVTGLKIRNDEPLATDTPTLQPDSFSVPSLPTSAPELATTIPPFPTPTPLPANPASLATSSIYSMFGRGAVLAIVFFIIIGIFLRLRRIQ